MTVEAVSADINSLAAGLGKVTIMEVCGTHTMAIAKSGLRRLLPNNIKLISGPGCPVCVTTPGGIEALLDIAKAPGVIMATFGDMLRVPGVKDSLESARADGAGVRIVYSPLDAVKIARENPDKQIVFAGVGFETTAPAVAYSVIAAAEAGLKNYFVYPLLKLVPPALQFLLANPACEVSAFLLPGHVSAVIGVEPYGFVASRYKKPAVIAGFEAGDILLAVRAVLRQLVAGTAKIENEYRRAVPDAGNTAAMDVINKVFTPAAAKWRAVGEIPGSGLAFKPEYSAFDARAHFAAAERDIPEPQGCICGAVLMGKAEPKQCALFGSGCTPRNPVGPCMVSSEGSCAASYRYGG